MINVAEKKKALGVVKFQKLWVNKEFQMDSIWSKINDDIPKYMSEVCKKYDMDCIKIDTLHTAIINKQCCLIIGIGKFETNLIYVKCMNEKICAFQCGNYLALRYDDDDRIGVINGIGADNIVRNDLIITANGLVNKCEDVLLGKNEWLEKYKKSSMFCEIPLSSDTVSKLSLYF